MLSIIALITQTLYVIMYFLLYVIISLCVNLAKLVSFANLL